MTTPHSLRSFLAILSMAPLLALSAQAAIQSIVDDQFADGDRTSQTPALGTLPYTSIPWYASVNKWIKTDNTGMVVTTDNGSAMIWGFFTPENSPLTLKTGESLKLSFGYTYSSDLKTYVDFRFGLFNFGSVTTRPKGTAFNSPELKGYFTITRSQSPKPDGATLYAENNGGTAEAQTFNNKTDKVVPVGAPFPAVDAKADPQVATMTITKTSDTSVDVTVSFQSGDTGTTRTDSTMNLNSFDSAAIYLGRLGEGNTVTISNIKIDLIKP